ncbi:MAG: GIY-YIG nuclease family protein [Candidatus Bathyarchaeia archaeon]
MNLERLSLKGIYILKILVEEKINVNIGALGRVYFPRGFYAYVGSAQKNLLKRLERHFEGGGKRFWHIDYLLAEKNVKIVGAYYKEADKNEECLTAQKLGIYGFSVKNFGCSDCKCSSHLFRFNDYYLLDRLSNDLGFILFIP